MWQARSLLIAIDHGAPEWWICLNGRTRHQHEPLMLAGEVGEHRWQVQLLQ